MVQTPRAPLLATLLVRLSQGCAQGTGLLDFCVKKIEQPSPCPPSSCVANQGQEQVGGAHAPPERASPPQSCHTWPLATQEALPRPLGWLMLLGSVFLQGTLSNRSPCHSGCPLLAEFLRPLSGRRVSRICMVGHRGSLASGVGSSLLCICVSPCGVGVALALPGPEGQGTEARKARKCELQSLSPLWSQESMQESWAGGV